MGNNKKPKCHNCIFSGAGFKIDKLTHHYCEDPKQYSQEKLDNGGFSLLDALVVFSDTCKNHEFKN